MIDDARTGSTGSLLTASFRGAPAMHDGNPLTLRVRFSESIFIRYVEFRKSGFTVTGGAVTRASRVDRRQDWWDIEVTPDSLGDVTISLPPNRPCKIYGAVCTYGGRRLSNRLEHTVEGPLPRVPDRPTGRELSPDIVALDWNDAPRADSYEVQFSFADQWIDLPANGTDIEFDGAGAVVKRLPAVGAFSFRVRGVNSYGASEWSPRLFIQTRVDWEGELTAAQVTDVSPVKSGYSIYGSLGWALSPDRFVHEGPPTQSSSWYMPERASRLA